MGTDFQVYLEGRVGRLQDDTGLTGVVAAVMTNGRLVGAAASGERRRGSGVPVTVDDRWHVGSITKSMTAVLLAVLEDDGLLSADDTVAALLPDVAVSDGWGACTLHHLLTHTAGAPENFPSRVQRVWPETPEELVAARHRLVADVLAGEPESPCGGRFAYSNVGYTIAGHIAETVAGRPYESLLRERVFAPLGLASAGFGPAARRRPEPGADRASRPVALVSTGAWNPFETRADNSPVTAPAGAVHMTILDLARYGAAHLDGRIRPVANPAAARGMGAAAHAGARRLRPRLGPRRT